MQEEEKLERKETGSQTKTMVQAALFMALGIVLPFLTGQIPEIGNRLLPMHIPVLICGFVCGWKYGLCVGMVVPILRSVMFGMPPMIPTAITMAFELAAYGACTGWLYAGFSKTPGAVYISLIGAMIVGRLVWGLACIPIYGLTGSAFSWKLFVAGGFLNAIPGIILQIVLVPIIVMALKRAKVMESENKKRF